MSATRTRAQRATKTRRRAKTARKWSHKVKTVSTFPPAQTFTKDAESIARIMARKSVSPKGLGSAIRMVQFFINRAGKDLPKNRRRELEKAKHLLQERMHAKRQGKRATK
jgi:tRNA(adenine34) deaminase